MPAKTRSRKAPKVHAHAFSDRVRFNWGYHDAASDVRNARSRILATAGPQSLTTVSRAFDAAYHDGYLAGVDEQTRGVYAGNSTAAWVASGRVDGEA